MITILIIIGVVVVVGGIAAGVVSGYRSRAAKSDWLGELSDIRRSSLGDDEEVTGALEAIHVDDEGVTAADGSDLASDEIPLVDVIAWPEPDTEGETDAETKSEAVSEPDPASEVASAFEADQPSETDQSGETESEVSDDQPIEASPLAGSEVAVESDQPSEIDQSGETESEVPDDQPIEASPLAGSEVPVGSDQPAETDQSGEADSEVRDEQPIEAGSDDWSEIAAESVQAGDSVMVSDSVLEGVQQVGFADTAERSSSAATVSNLKSVTDAPNRIVEDAGTQFREYDRPGGSLLRIEATDPQGLRVLIGGADASRATCAIDLPRGVLWHLAAQDVVVEACSIRTPAGWVTTTGTLLVLVDDTGWSYAMCLDGVATVEVSSEGHQARLEAGHIGRGRNGTIGFELANVGAEALESEGAVRRQRRLDHTESVGD